MKTFLNYCQLLEHADFQMLPHYVHMDNSVDTAFEVESEKSVMESTHTTLLANFYPQKYEVAFIYVFLFSQIKFCRAICLEASSY